MTKLNELIQQLCPDGVKYYTLNTVCNVYDGTHKTPKYTDSGIKFASVENIANPYATEKYISISDYEKYKIKPQRNDLLMTRIGSIGVCTVIESDEPLAYYVSLALLRPDNSILNSRYLKYAIESLHCRKELRKRTLVNAVPIKINMGDIGKITLPVPPLPVQSEIVRILDNFTEITQKLTTELAAELIARKQQYEYYRNRLLAFDVRGGGTSRTEWRMFGETCFLQAGKAIDAESISKEKTLEYCIPCYGGNGLRGYVRKANQKGEKPLVGRQGALCGNVCFAKGDYYATEHAVVVTDRGFYNSRFLYHLLVNKNLNQYKTAGVQPGLSVTKLETILLPVPETEIQNRIADVLDNFDAICTDLSSGLPAEIEARQKQYEYYRDKLLSFEEKI